jgi:tRNA(Ile)-lysidine synthase TilS/MesJ
LGVGASEAAARKARYNFLHTVRQHSGAQAIITAHHQDDLLETAILNILRGTGRRGLSSLKSTDVVKRPLLDVPKQQLLHHAHARGIVWREDATNTDTRYLRNYIRRHITPRLDENARKRLLGIIGHMNKLNNEIEGHLVNYLHIQREAGTLDRHRFIMLSHEEAREVMAAWLRRHDIRGFDRKMIDRLIVAAKTFVPNQRADIVGGASMLIGKDYLALER